MTMDIKIKRMLTGTLIVFTLIAIFTFYKYFTSENYFDNKDFINGFLQGFLFSISILWTLYSLIWFIKQRRANSNTNEIKQSARRLLYVGFLIGSSSFIINYISSARGISNIFSIVLVSMAIVFCITSFFYVGKYRLY